MPDPKQIGTVFYPDALEAVADFLVSGGVLAYPSESIWGLGCDAANHAAIERIIHLKERNLGKGLIVLTDKAERLTPLLAHLPSHEQVAILSVIRQTTAEQMLQQKQATTWLVPVAKGLLSPLLVGGFDTLAVRVTPHPTLAKLCQCLISPTNPYGFLVSTSCNISGQAPANSLAQAQTYFGDAVAYLADEGLGFDRPSRIIDVVSGQTLR